MPSVRAAASRSRDPELTTCPIRGLTFQICQVGVNTYPSLYQTGRNKLTRVIRPIEDKTPHRPLVGRVPLTRLPHGATRRAGRGELGASRAAPGLQPRTRRWPWVRGAAPSLTTADGRVCNDRSLGPLVGTGD